MIAAKWCGLKPTEGKFNEIFRIHTWISKESKQTERANHEKGGERAEKTRPVQLLSG